MGRAAAVEELCVGSAYPGGAACCSCLYGCAPRWCVCACNSGGGGGGGADYSQYTSRAYKPGALAYVCCYRCIYWGCWGGAGAGGLRGMRHGKDVPAFSR